MEIWEITGETWRLPIGLNWIDSTFGEVIPGAGAILLNRQKRALADTLKPVLLMKIERQFIYRSDLVTMARKSTETDPEEIVEWFRPPMPHEAEAATNFTSPDPFIEGYVRSPFAMNRDPLIMDLLWTSFVKFMFHWFLNEQKELNLGFCRLVPLCLRKNWSHVVATWEGRKTKISDFDKFNPSLNSQIKRGIPAYLCSGNVVGLEKNGKSLRYTLDVILDPAWHENHARREMQMQSKERSWMIYWKQIVPDRLKRQLPLAMEVYAHQLREAKISVMAVSKGVVDGSANQWQDASILGKAGPPPSLTGYRSVLCHPFEKEGGAEAVAGEDAPLSEALSDLQSREENLRNSGSKMA